MNDEYIEVYREMERWSEEVQKTQIAKNSAYPLGEILEVTDKNISEIINETFQKSMEKHKEELAKMPKFSEQMESKEKDKLKGENIMNDKYIDEIHRRMAEWFEEEKKAQIAKNSPSFIEESTKMIDAQVDARAAVCGDAYVKMQLITKLLELLFPTKQYVDPETSETRKMKIEIVAVIRKYF